jgi:uncharacterized protein (TIGR03067 family)
MVKSSPAILVVLLLAAAPAPDEIKKDTELFRGTWRLASLEHDGRDVTTDETRTNTFVFEKGVVSAYQGKSVAWKGTFKIDPSRKPKTIDITITEGDILDGKGKQMHGIYEFEKDALRWCSADVGEKEKDRPNEFGTKGNTAHLLYNLKREKP